MRVLFLGAVAAIFALGAEPSLAQVATVPATTTPPSSTTLPSSTQPPALLGQANLPRPAGTLGTIQFNLGSPIAGSAAGAIQICPASGTAAATVNFPVDATDMTANPAPGFGTSEISGNCNPGSPAPSPGILSGSEFSGVLQGSQFSDGAVPLSATEAGGMGLSPLIAVPGPASPSVSCAGTLGTSEPSGLPAPYYTDVAGTPAQPGC